jgi:hypothetical protein
MAKLAQERCLLVNAPITCPISEALDQAIGVSTDNIIWIDESVPVNLQSTLGVTNLRKVFAMICDAPNAETTPWIDWFLAIYPFPPSVEIQVDAKMQDWLNEIRDQVKLLLQYTLCRAMIIIVPHKIFPRQVFTKLSRSLTLPRGWTTTSGHLDNTKHGGSVETWHDFLLITEEETIQHFAVPEKSAATPESIASALANMESVPTFQLEEFNVMPPSVTDVAMNQTPYEAKVQN